MAGASPINVPSKLGPHCILPTADARLLVDSGCRIVKLVDDFGVAAEYKAANPGLTIIGRSFSAINFLQELGQHATPEAAARGFVDRQRPVYLANPLIFLWEGHNEPSFGSPGDPGAIDLMGQYARFEIERMRLMADLGLRCVLGNFSTGYPEVQNDNRLWEAFLPAIERASEFGAVLGLHEYAAPWLWWFVGGYQAGSCDQSSWFAGPDDDGWLTLRYRKVYRQVFAPRGLLPPMAITELGLDRAGGGCPGMVTGNWRDVAEWWAGWDGSRDPIDYWRSGERDAGRYYADQLTWYDSYLRRDSYVIGATVFTFGPTATWDRYGVSGTRIPGYLANYIQSIRNEADPEPTPPPPTPDPEPPPPPPDPTPTPEPDPPPTGDPMIITLEQFNDLDLQNLYTWDAENEEFGNTILIPSGLDFDYVFDPNVRVTWTDRKPGSPTFGQMRRQDQANVKPECVTMNPQMAGDVRAGSPYTGDLLKAFKGWGSIWLAYGAIVNGLQVGAKYKFSWPVFPDLVMRYEGGLKVFADDPDAGFMRLRALPGSQRAVAGAVNPSAEWYDGGDFVIGQWKTLELVFDASDPIMTLAFEAASTFALQNSGFFLAQPKLELVSTPTDPNTGPQEGTVMGSLAMIEMATEAVKDGFGDIENAVTNLRRLIGS